MQYQFIQTINSFLLIFSIAGSLFLSSCKPEQAKASSIEVNKEIKQVVRVNYADDPDGVKIFNYDEDGNITMMIQGGDTTLYTYSPTLITKRYAKAKNHWDATTYYELDETGKIVSGRIKGEDGKIMSISKFIYDKEGYLAKSLREVAASKSITFYEFEYKDGNMVRMKEVNAEGKILANFVCEYYTDKMMDQNIFLQAYTEEILSKDRFGKKSKNFVKNSCNISAEGDTLSHLNYTYEDVKDPKTMKMMEHDVNNEFKMPITYHFR